MQFDKTVLIKMTKSLFSHGFVFNCDYRYDAMLYFYNTLNVECHSMCYQCCFCHDSPDLSNLRSLTWRQAANLRAGKHVMGCNRSQ